ncbi:phosphodiesterase [Variovorax fucosicus]|uniref:phosphodiesterase n=1 Tax=Variovorax fucosicus TaxID=3053517 RepID=UPI0025771608|nr:phosphodiesterase [Variovorax sp. J22G47]MDM0056267.1 phosphodiesterase [Variovorax sp. J22G47]
MLIAQLSDPHVRPAGMLYHGVADSNRMLADAIRHLQQLDRRPDLVLLTGDLVEEGRPEEYAQVRALLAALTIPWLVIPGNHDHRDNFRAAFADQCRLPAEGPLHYCDDAHPVRIVALDSCVPGRHHGHIEPDGLRWLHATLSADPHKPTLVMLHHPPFVSGIPYMDDYRYMAPEPLEAVLRAFDNIEIVLCGHVHRAMLRRWAGTVVCACPSTTTEIALQLRPDAPPQSYLGTPACMLHLWSAEHGMVSHLSAIGEFEGPYPFA